MNEPAGSAPDVTPHTGRDAAAALAAIVQSSDDAIYSKDPEAKLTSWNAAAERLYGYAASEVLGKHVSLLVPADRRGEETQILGRVLQGERIDHFETRRVRKDGEVVDVSISVSGVADVNGNIVEAAVIARDLTEQKRFAVELAEERKRQLTVARMRAVELNDEVVQGLAVAKLAIELGESEQGLKSVTAVLERARSIVTRLLEEQQLEGGLQPGDLVRETTADALWATDPREL